jgi:hypothetical protein
MAAACFSETSANICQNIRCENPEEIMKFFRQGYMTLEEYIELNAQKHEQVLVIL